jgi:ribose/xylose/arabinose/galactoside ABC-type transport system permease subunit
VVILLMLGNVFNLLNINLYWQQVLRGLILVFVVGISQFQVLKRSARVLGTSQPAQGIGERR